MFDKFHLFGFTLSMNVRYITPIRLSERWVQARGKVVSVEGRKVTVAVWLLNHKNERCAEGELVFLQPKMSSATQIFGQELAHSFSRWIHQHHHPPPQGTENNKYPDNPNTTTIHKSAL